MTTLSLRLLNDQQKYFTQFAFFNSHLSIFDDKIKRIQIIDSLLAALALEIFDSNIYDSNNEWLIKLDEEKSKN